jgi:hypothetical protein
MQEIYMLNKKKNVKMLLLNTMLESKKLQMKLLMLYNKFLAYQIQSNNLKDQLPTKKDN